MTTDFRALCAELVEKVEFTWGSGTPEDVEELLNRARAALADGPAVSEGREPASATEQPSDEIRAALTDLIHDLELADWPRHLEDKFREDLIRARILLLSTDQNLSRMRVTQGQGCTDQASH